MKDIAGISMMSVGELRVLKHDLLVEKMKLDKFFSVFLEENELDPKNKDTIEWQLYNNMTAQYHSTDRLIRITDFYLLK